MADTPRMGSSNLATLWAKLKSYFVKGNTGVFYGTCATAAATAAKAVTCADFASGDLKPGAMIFVQFDITNSAAVADLTLNVNGTGAKNIKQVRNNSLSNIPGVGYLLADRTYPFYYDGTYWCLILDYNLNDPNYRLRTNYYYRKKLKTVCYRYLILLPISDTEAVPVNAVDRGYGSTSKTLTTESFDPFGSIAYYSYTGTVSAGAKPGNGYVYEGFELIDLRYSFNTGTTLTADKPVYIVCVPQSDGMVKLHSSPIAQDLPTTEDGRYYIYLGMAYDTYRCGFEIHKPVYQFKDGRIREVVDDARTVDGHTVAADVPSGAKFTDTTYTAQTTSIGSASIGTAIPADDITAWTANTPTAVTKKTVVTSASGATASYANGVLTLTDGSFGTGDSVTVTPGTAASLSYTAKSIPNISVSSKTVVTGITAS